MVFSSMRVSGIVVSEVMYHRDKDYLDNHLILVPIKVKKAVDNFFFFFSQGEKNVEKVISLT